MATHVRPPGQSTEHTRGDRRYLLQSGVRLFEGDSLRLIEHEINEWADIEGVQMLKRFRRGYSRQGYRVLIAYSRSVRP
jgi:hypothetical protein